MRFAPLMLAVGLCRAENACPWLNAATAAGVLGGPVKSSVTPTACQFVHDNAILHIEVQTRPAALSVKCESKGIPVHAIGNEAVACTVRDTGIVVSRVREQQFVVWIRSSDPAVKERVQKVAGQVAGNLY